MLFLLFRVEGGDDDILWNDGICQLVAVPTTVHTNIVFINLDTFMVIC
jgi:hypothetical protein